MMALRFLPARSRKKEPISIHLERELFADELETVVERIG
jgi:hypothetical protein